MATVCPNYSTQLRIATMQERLDAPYHIVVDGYKNAHSIWPHRIEPIVLLARYYNRHAYYQEAYDLIRGWAQHPPVADDACCVDWIENGAIFRELALCAFRLGHHERALEACKPIATIPRHHHFVERLRNACKGIRATLCLNMIVRNEASVIRRCIESVRPIIDHWIIVDTGSTDGTQDVVCNALQDISGTLYERPWVNFGHNRGEALELAKGTADYLLIMDADDFLEFDGPTALPLLLSDMYQMWQKRRRLLYCTTQIVCTELPWHWKGVVHEGLHCDVPYSIELLTHVRYRAGKGGARSKDPTTPLRDASLLEKSCVTAPRDLFTLAMSYADAREYAKAIATYRKLIMSGAPHGAVGQMVFVARLMIARLLQVLETPFEEVVKAFLEAHRSHPHRPEPFYFLANLYNSRREYQRAYEWLMRYAPSAHKEKGISYPWIEEYGLQCELALAAYYTGHMATAHAAAEAALACPTLPPSWRWQLERIINWSTV